MKLESHKKFVRNEKNFISLDLIIARGPNMEQFLDDVLKYHHEHVKEGLQMRCSKTFQAMSLPLVVVEALVIESCLYVSCHFPVPSSIKITPGMIT